MCEHSNPCLASLQYTCHLLHFLDELLSPVFPGLCWLDLGKQAPFFYLWAQREHPVFPPLMTMSAVHSTFIKSPWSCLVGWAICFLLLPDWDIYKRCERAGGGTGCVSTYPHIAEMIFMTSSGLAASHEFVPVALISINLDQLQFFQMASLLSNR